MESIEKLKARLDLYQNSLSQLRKEVPLYFQKHSGLQKKTRALSVVLKNLASSELNPKLQNAIYFSSLQYEGVADEEARLSSGEEVAAQLIGEAQRLIAQPFKEAISDVALEFKAQQISFRHKEHIESILPIHSQLFEQHRIRSLKMLLSKTLRSDLRYHCAAVERLSSALEAISSVEEGEEEGSEGVVLMQGQGQSRSIDPSTPTPISLSMKIP